MFSPFVKLTSHSNWKSICFFQLQPIGYFFCPYLTSNGEICFTGSVLTVSTIFYFFHIIFHIQTLKDKKQIQKESATFQTKENNNYDHDCFVSSLYSFAKLFLTKVINLSAFNNFLTFKSSSFV